MNSRESPGIVAGQIAVVGVRMLDIAIEKGVAAGVKAATDRIEEERKGRYDRRLHNTRLLLKNYRVLKHHALDAVHTGARANEVISENAVDILDDLESMGFRKVDDRLYIESIKRSQQRTRIIIEHIDEMLRYWRIDCEQSGREEALRRYRIVVDTYISDDQMTAEELAQREHIEKRTVYKDIKAAMRPLSALIFGIDGIKQE